MKVPDGSPAACRMSAVILEIWTGLRTPHAAASALGVWLPRYYRLEQPAVDALVAACELRPHGPGASPQRQLREIGAATGRQLAGLARLQALVPS